MPLKKSKCPSIMSLPTFVVADHRCAVRSGRGGPFHSLAVSPRPHATIDAVYGLTYAFRALGKRSGHTHHRERGACRSE